MGAISIGGREPSRHLLGGNQLLGSLGSRLGSETRIMCHTFAVL